MTGDTEWHNDKSGAFCWFNNDEQGYKNVYRGLYNWYAVNSGKLCPKGYRATSSGEWDQLIDYVGGENEAGGMLKETGTIHWNDPNTGATDAFGFKAVGGGLRDEVGFFGAINVQGLWWTTNEYSEWVAPSICMTFGNKEIFTDGDSKSFGYSVRCIKE